MIFRHNHSIGTITFPNHFTFSIFYGRHIIFINSSAVIDFELHRRSGSFNIQMNRSSIGRGRPLRINHNIVCRHCTVEIECHSAFLILEPSLEGICFRKTSRTIRNVRRKAIAIKRSLVKNRFLFHYTVIVVVSKVIAVSGIANIKIIYI